MDFVLPRVDVETLSGRLTDEQADMLSRYGAAILDASTRLNLVSRQSLDQLADHIVDSAALLRVAEIDGLRVADLGSGGGLPGMVLAILRPTAEVTLVESRRGKVVFLKRVVRELGLSNVRVLHARIEEVPAAERFDLVVARALGDVSEVLPACLKLAGQDAPLVLFKGPRWEEEAAEARAIAERCGYELRRAEKVELPGLGRSTTFVEFHVKRP